MKETGVDHVYIEPIKETPCEHIEQLRAIEGQYIGELGTLIELKVELRNIILMIIKNRKQSMVNCGMKKKGRN